MDQAADSDTDEDDHIVTSKVGKRRGRRGAGAGAGAGLKTRAEEVRALATAVDGFKGKG